MSIVPAVRRKLVPREIAQAIAREFAAQGDPLPKEAIELFTAQVQLETGGYATNNNPGNAMAAGFRHGAEVFSWNGDAWRPPWFFDPSSPTYARMVADPPTAPSAFRSYPTLAAGLHDHVKMLRSAFPALVAAAKTGDAEAFRRAVVTPDPVTHRAYSPDYGPGAAATLASIRADFRRAGVFEGLGASGGAAVAAVVVVLGALALWWKKS